MSQILRDTVTILVEMMGGDIDVMGESWIGSGAQIMRSEIDLTILEPFTPQEIQTYIDYLWRNGATDVAAAVLSALRIKIPDGPLFSDITPAEHPASVTIMPAAQATE